MPGLDWFDPVMDCQKVFRQILHCMSRPGQAVSISDGKAAPTLPPVVAVAMTLLDGNATFAAPGEQHGELVAYATRVLGSKAAPVAEADFIFFYGGAARQELKSARRGNLLFPEKGATLICSVDSLGSAESRAGSGDDHKLKIEGPGVKGRVILEVTGLAEGNLLMLKDLNREFPLGVDTILVSVDGMLSCLPRSISVSWG